jgi:diguanylate cyclase (GGDEF)-like protein/PAS domain S-box-containing protein
MASAALSQKLRNLRVRVWPILCVVGLLGLTATAWVTSEMNVGARGRLEQRFQLAARERADAIARAFQNQIAQLTLLQRLFDSVGEVDWPVFERFVQPMTGAVGVRGYAWAPLVEPGGRDEFEQFGRQVWGAGFSIIELDEADGMRPSAVRARHFPVLYTLPVESTRVMIGLDLRQASKRGSTVDRAIDQAIVDGVATASGFGHSVVDPELVDSAVSIVIPVYYGGSVPLTREARRSAIRGVLLTRLDVAALFDAANVAANVGTNAVGLQTSLVDRADLTTIIHRWPAVGDVRPASPPGAALAYEQDFTLGNRVWTTRVEPDAAWMAANAPANRAYIPVAGLLLTFLLLAYLHRLLARSALADVLAATHAEDVEKRRLAESWANTLALAVEQNPATVMITDLAGDIQYVNEKFVETSGYSREEAIGQSSRFMAGDATAPAYKEMRSSAAAGRSWRGELQAKHRDGSLYWERVLVSPIRDGEGAITNYMAIKENISELRSMMNLLRESESRFRSAMSVMAEGLVIVSADGVFVFANNVAEEYLESPPEGLQGLTAEDAGVDRLRHDGSPCLPEEYPINVTLREGREIRGYVLGLRSRSGSGDIRWVQVNTSPLAVGHAQKTGVVMTFSDITERRRAEEQLHLAYEAIKCSGEGILVTDAAHRIISVNPAFEMVTGYNAREVTGQTPSLISSLRHDERFFAAMREVAEKTGHWQGEVWNRRKNGEVYPEWLGVSAVPEADGRVKYFVYIYSDMTERKETQQRIEFLAHHDPLTGLPNRLLLRDRVEQAQAQAARQQSRVALMFLDLDRFKTINDSLGHPVGDALLLEVVERLKHCVRESDTISRQGGDEFIILLNDIRDSEAVSRVADKIHQCMAEPIVLGNHSLSSSFSIGVAFYPDDGEDFDSLLQKADTAMYYAKEAGRNAHRFFTEQMNQKVVEHLTLQTQLRRALENGEFVLHYQPQLDLQDGRIVGVEALIRWNSPHGGLISPGRFIPVAEDSGLIAPIGAWVLGEACRQAHAWQEAGLPPFVVAVNLSAMQFRRPELVNTVINALVLSDLDAQWLELELTESILIQDAEVTLDTVRRLKALGLKLSVDDFGTGYSSLTYLKRFAVDKLKIDQSFVRDLLSDPDDAAIVRAIIQMAHSLKLKTIAEGVESEELSNLLRLFHCDEIQGYWFARPMPADDLERFVREHMAQYA